MIARNVKINAFQLCYDKFYNGHDITCFLDEEISHIRIDTGAKDFHSIETSLLVADGIFPRVKISPRVTFFFTF
jgi:hypothetical protein